jgi:hypothetical protein
MATKAQVQANRANAQKSTGPRTDEGKAAVAQNAVKHGLSGRRDVIQGEDQGEFDRHREGLLNELRPQGAVESLLAERAVSLSWRLKRVERMHNEVIDVLLAHEATPLARQARSMVPGKAAADDGLDLGRAMIRDFANGRVLDRLMMYERRTEHSLLKTLTDLHLRRLRIREYISRHMDEIGNEPAGSGSAWGECSDASEEVGRGRPTYEEPPCGAATNTAGGADADGMFATRMSRDSSSPSFQYSTDAQEEAGVAEPSCKTKPIPSGTNGGQVSFSERVKEDLTADGREETKPISPAETSYSALVAAGVGN